MTKEESRLQSLWNGRDPILKERLFGLTGNEGNHGEDVKEYYFYLDSTPTHSYMKYLYKYPQSEFPYAQLVEENRRRGRSAPEFELVDTGIFENDRYFDVFVEYAKGSPDDILIRIEAINRGSEAAELHLLPTLWFRNTWSWNAQGGTTVVTAWRTRRRHYLDRAERKNITASDGSTVKAVRSRFSQRTRPTIAAFSARTMLQLTSRMGSTIT